MQKYRNCYCIFQKLRTAQISQKKRYIFNSYHVVLEYITLSFQSNTALEKCVALMKIDYSLITVSNTSGELSANYPSQILILEYELAHNSNAGGTTLQPSLATSTIYESMHDAQKLRDLMSKARCAR